VNVARVIKYGFKKYVGESMSQLLLSVGFILVVVGVAVILFSIILATLQARRGGRVKGGGVILIGPIPIIFGSDARMVKHLIYLAIVLMIILTVFMIIPTLL